MKHTATLLCTLALAGTTAQAGDFSLERLWLGSALASPNEMAPVPDTVGGIPAVSPAAGPYVAVPCAEPLFHRVKYKDLDEVAPCHTVKIIKVRNPCKRCCTDPDCVNIQICVPETCCDDPRICSIFGGRRVRYDYGKYEVDVRVKRDYIEVDYQD